MAKIKITLAQLEFINDTIGDVEFLELEEGNGGNIDAIPDGLEEEKFTIDEKGNEL
jgi:hypothetical protein